MGLWLLRGFTRGKRGDSSCLAPCSTRRFTGHLGTPQAVRTFINERGSNEGSQASRRPTGGDRGRRDRPAGHRGRGRLGVLRWRSRPPRWRSVSRAGDIVRRRHDGSDGPGRRVSRPHRLWAGARRGIRTELRLLALLPDERPAAGQHLRLHEHGSGRIPVRRQHVAGPAQRWVAQGGTGREPDASRDRRAHRRLVGADRRAGHLRRAPALPVQQGHLSRPDKRREPLRHLHRRRRASGT